NRKIRVFINKEKKLAAGSRNEAFKNSKGKFVALLDHDTEVDKDWLTELLGIFEKYRDAGTVQSLVLDISKRNIIQHAGLKVNSYLGWVIPMGFGIKVNNYPVEEGEIFAD